MIEQIITSSVLIACIIMLRVLLENRISQRVKYALWLLVVVKLLVPLPMYETNLSVMNLVHIVENGIRNYTVSDNMEEKAAKDSKVKEESAEYKKADSENFDLKEINLKNSDLTNKGISKVTPKWEEKGDRPIKETPISIWDISMVIWLVGIFIFGVWFLFCNIRFYRYLKKNRKEHTDVPCKLKLYETTCINSPCLFGMKSPAIYLTTDSMESEQKLSYIIAHELIHYKHKDHIWSYIRCLCVMVYWYHPLVWLAAFLSVRDSELACDEGTIKCLGEENRKAYGAVLIEMASGYPAVYNILLCSTCILGGKSEMKKRIEMIVRKPKMIVSTLAILLILVICVVGVTFSKAETKKEDDIVSEVTMKSEPVQIVTGEAIEQNNENVVTGKEMEKIESDMTDSERNNSNPTGIDKKIETATAGFISPAIEETVKPQSILTAEPIKGEVYIEIYPNEEIFESRKLYGFYVIPDKETQEKLKTLLDKPDKTQKLYSNWMDDYPCQELGYEIYYKNKGGRVFSNNILLNNIKDTVQINKELCALLKEIVEKQLDYKILDIHSIKNIVSAKLDYRHRKTLKEYSQVIENKKILSKFEDWFSNAEVMMGGSACPFADALLTLTLKNGEVIKLSMATDSCNVFMANGVYYEYRGKVKKGEYFSAESFFKYFDKIPFVK